MVVTKYWKLSKTSACKVCNFAQNWPQRFITVPMLFLPLFFGMIRSSNHRKVCSRETHFVRFCFFFAWLYTATVSSCIPPLSDMYLDDVSVGGSFEDMFHDLDIIGG